MAAKTLEELFELASGFFPQTKQNYPHWDLSTPESTKISAIRHGHTHLSAHAGDIGRAIEHFDHGENLDLQKLQLTVAKTFLTCINFAKNLDLDAEKLVDLAIAGARGNPQAVTEKTLIERVIMNLRADHPLPWSIEQDWTSEVKDADGELVLKCQSGAEAQAIIEIAERQQKEADDAHFENVEEGIAFLQGKSGIGTS